MNSKPGSIFGGTLLIGGSCIGAGMLGLPIVTGLCGFKLSLLIFILSWAFMTLTGFLVAEANSWFSSEVNLISMSAYTLGKLGQSISWSLYLFLFYSLLVAYLAGIGNVFSSLGFSSFSFLGTTAIVLLFSIIIWHGTQKVDIFNRILMTGKIGSYVAMVLVGINYIDKKLLAQSESRYILFSLPLMIISFGFHNMIPTITNYMKGDMARVKKVIILGSTFALVIYIIWDLIVLGIVPKEGEYGIINSLKTGKDAAYAIAGILGNSWISKFAQSLAFFSFLTSLLIQSLALTHFLSDGLKIRKKNKEPLSIIFFTIVPPFVLSILKPDIFFKALDFAGGICAVALFGILPVIMVWRGRYYKNNPSAPKMVRGGKLALILIFLFALFIILFQLSLMLGVHSNEFKS